MKNFSFIWKNIFINSETSPFCEEKFILLGKYTISIRNILHVEIYFFLLMEKIYLFGLNILLMSVKL
jgi:hypothetical protein